MVERAFNPNRIPASPKALDLVREVQNWVQNFEHFLDPRKRRRKPKDQERFERTVAAVISDAICSYHENPQSWIYLSLSHRTLKKKSRYQPFSFGQKLADLLKKMSNADLEFLRMTLGKKQVGEFQGVFQRVHKRTTISAGERLIRRIHEHQIGPEDFGFSDDEEIIILKAPKRGYKDKGEWIDYQDNDQTLAWRNDLRFINGWLARSPLAYVGKEKVEVANRRLLRIFNNGVFNEGGRLYGGFWMGLSKLDRLANIRIDGERVAELDYGQMALRLLYGKLGQQLPAGEDLYNVAPYNDYREGIKLIINSALFKEKRGKMPHGGKALFPRKLKYRDILADVERYHNSVSHKFFSGEGMNLQFLESEILLALLREGIRINSYILPIHDAILVQVSKAEQMKDIMLETFKRLSGVEGLVKIHQ